MELSKVIAQENEFDFARFTNDMALWLGNRAVQKNLERKQKHIGIRIVHNDLLVFQYLMPDKKEDMWLKRKENAVRATGHSSLYYKLCLENYPELAQSSDYAKSGGGFPIYENGVCTGAICISGLSQNEDHELIIECLQELMEEYA